MILIADSGSTKTDWAFVENGEIIEQKVTPGINPVHMSETEIREILTIDSSLFTPFPSDARLPVAFHSSLKAVHFYGAGCIPPFKNKVEKILAGQFPEAEIHVESDMLGAARALFGREAGIACIMGTGSNSCVYDGENIVDNIPPLGYILGDEGSGAYLGRVFLQHLFKRQLSDQLREEFLSEYHLTYEEIIDRVYRQPGANRFLASLCPFIRKHLVGTSEVGTDESTIDFFVGCAFEDFFNFNIHPYGRPELPVGFIGSVAWHFREYLSPVSEDLMEYPVKAIVQSPMSGLVKYHSA